MPSMVTSGEGRQTRRHAAHISWAPRMVKALDTASTIFRIVVDRTGALH